MKLDTYLSLERGRASRLAERLGISRGYLSDIRSGRTTPSLELALRIEAETGRKVRCQDLAPSPTTHEAA